MSARKFRIGLVVATVVGVAIRLIATLAHYRNLAPPPIDATAGSTSWLRAQLFADGHGFVDAVSWFRTGSLSHSAAEPPLPTAVLGSAAWIGADTPTALRIVATLIGASAISIVGSVGARVASRRAGLVAATLVAIHPNLWVDGALLRPEYLLVPLLGAAALAALRFVDRPSHAGAAVTGATIGLAALSNAGAIWLTLLLIVPLSLTASDVHVLDRLRWAGVGAAAAALTVTPWVAASWSDVAVPVALTSAVGEVAQLANCDVTYGPDLLGSADLRCLAPTGLPVTASIKEVDQARLDSARAYAADHRARLVTRVIPARLGRTFGLYRARQSVDVAEFYEQRGGTVMNAATVINLAVLPLAAAGAVLLRRRPRTLVVLGSLVVLTIAASAFAGGLVRYRVSADVAMVILAGVAVDTLMRSRRPGTARDVSPRAT